MVSQRDKIHHTLGRSSRSRSVMYETCAPSFSKHVVCKSFDVKISYRRRGNVMQIYTTSNFSIFGGLGDFGWMSNNHKRNDMEWLITVYIIIHSVCNMPPHFSTHCTTRCLRLTSIFSERVLRSRFSMQVRKRQMLPADVTSSSEAIIRQLAWWTKPYGSGGLRNSA